MVKQNYQIQKIRQSRTAKAIAKNQPISLKYSTEIIANIKGMRIDKAMEFLERIRNMEEYLPLRKYNKKVGHRKGEAKGFAKAGRYPIRAVTTFLGLLEGVRANADYKGLDSDNLIITHMFASQGFQRLSYQAKGKISGKKRKKKSTHLEIVVTEGK
ncbi:50S ribosomal protein L22 [uncultured archaeon]|nr:50S ribosomal protein L22 [uncultured archaeon]